MSDLLIGQETSVALLVDGNLESRIDGITSCDITFELTVVETRHLGALADQYISVFKGMTISIKSNVTGEDYLSIADAIVAKAQRKSGAAIEFTVSTVLTFPSGVVRAVTIPKISWEAIPLSIPAGDELVTMELSGKASGYFLD